MSWACDVCGLVTVLAAAVGPEERRRNVFFLFLSLRLHEKMGVRQAYCGDRLPMYERHTVTLCDV